VKSTFAQRDEMRQIIFTTDHRQHSGTPNRSSFHVDATSRLH